MINKKSKYAIAPKRRYESYITPGKKYEITSIESTMFTIIDDDGSILYCLEKGCPHLDEHNWKLVSR